MNPPHRTPVENILALAPIVMLAAILGFVAWKPEVLKVVEVKDLVFIVVTWLLAKGTDIFSWFYGSSKGSAMASQALVEQADKNADRVATAAATAAAKPLPLTPDMQVGDMAVLADNVTVSPGREQR